MQERRPRDFGHGDSGIVERQSIPDTPVRLRREGRIVPGADLDLGAIMEFRVVGTSIQELNVYSERAKLSWSFPSGDELTSQTGFVVSIRRA